MKQLSKIQIKYATVKIKNLTIQMKYYKVKIKNFTIQMR